MPTASHVRHNFRADFEKTGPLQNLQQNCAVGSVDESTPFDVSVAQTRSQIASRSLTRDKGSRKNNSRTCGISNQPNITLGNSSLSS
ncbi:hypothetical protein TNCT_675161 [Trichonephila clavata]|uniref:Uncharacterized protein n=1 Tax=Trichonephila clavata TaxID=2740835 RepID=A0A8X6G582_TRICU|nr:hypothetical protein TNCT_675161 [Trichonephila clavata]